jgi:O-antigen/teichoic acid export membrane protein
MEVLVTRETAIALTKTGRETLGSFLRWSLGNTLLLSGALALTGLLTVSFWPHKLTQEVRLAFQFALAGVPLICLQLSAGAIIRGFRRVDLTVFLNEILLPALMLGWIALCLAGKIGASASVAFEGRLIAVALILFLYLILLVRLELPWPWKAASREQIAIWRKGMNSMALLRGIDTAIVRLPVLILGLLIGPVSVALFSLSTRIADSVVLTMSIVSLTIGPQVAQFHAERDYVGMQALVTRSTQVISAWATAFAVVLILSGRWILGWFGPQFSTGYPVLLVLIAGRTVDAITGNVGLVMTMGGMERVVAKTRAYGLALATILCFVLIPKWGAMGGAIGYATALIFYNLVLVLQLYRRLGIFTFVVGRTRPLSKNSERSC